MAAVQPIPPDEIAAEFAAELASSWDPDDGPLVLPARPAPARPWRPAGPQDLDQAAARVRPVSLAGDQVFPVVGALAGVLPAGLPRGAIVTIAAGPGGGAVSLALALSAGPSAAGSWTALVGLPGVGLAAAAELGMSLERVVVVAPPPADQWATVVGALVGACDLVLVTPPSVVRLAETRRLAARARERGSVLVALEDSPTIDSPPVDGPADDRPARPALDATLRLRVREQGWTGLGEGHGHLRSRWMRIELDGRRHATRPRRADLWLPDDQGRLRVAEAGELPLTAPVRLGPAGPAAAPAATADDVRRQRIRRVVQQPLPTSTEAPTIWSDAG